MPDRRASGYEDTTELPRASGEAMEAYTNGLGPIGIRDLLNAYGGNQRELAEALAANKGTKVASERRSILKWLAFETGGSGQKRNPLKNKATQAQFRALMASKRPPEHAVIRIEGSIRYSNTARDRTVNINTPDYPVDIPAMLEALAQGNTSEAYQEIFASYAPSMSVEPGADIEIRFF